VQVSGQEHFYLETNTCCVIPHENNEYTIYSSTQVRMMVALVLKKGWNPLDYVLDTLGKHT
jgi:xanthine dehydrogenase molybdopterin-binding subunit B